MSGFRKGNALKAHLLAVLGEDLFIRLCQELGGTRRYIASNPRADGELIDALGDEGAARLSEALAPATIRIPLARRERALFYRAQGLSDGRIARRLGMTETGVSKLFAREGGLPARPANTHKGPRQLPLL
ncbi:MAG: hypothetical protein IT472_08935 [Thermomonas sp.]|uniref:hypothetical protein n=1 Tax=Thermomonas sp. TaxID=1971895 RepID=UPI00260A8B49|nr:hypothetical protein [Thermomonas sp.]MCC7097290.1 hypothetical protein [Thermomonas sp.]